jgi:hypothetical protein
MIAPVSSTPMSECWPEVIVFLGGFLRQGDPLSEVTIK